MKQLLVCLFVCAARYADAQFLPNAVVAERQGVTSCVVKQCLEGDSTYTTDSLLLEKGKWRKLSAPEVPRKQNGVYDSLGRLICTCQVPPPKNCYNDTVGTAYYYGTNGKLRLAIGHSCEKGDTYKYFLYDAKDSLQEIRYTARGDILVTLVRYFRNKTGGIDSVIYYWTTSPEHPEKDTSILRIATIISYDKNRDGLADQIKVYDPYCVVDGNEHCEFMSPRLFIYMFTYRRKR